MIILIDRREQKPFFIHSNVVTAPLEVCIEWATLKTGDYSLQGMSSPDPLQCQHSITIERKSLSDLFGSAGRNRHRLEAEFYRMSFFDHAEIVIEDDLRALFNSPPDASAMVPKTVYRTLVAWSQRYGVKVWPCPSRSFAEQHTFLTLKRFWDDRQKGGKQEFCKI